MLEKPPGWGWLDGPHGTPFSDPWQGLALAAVLTLTACASSSDESASAGENHGKSVAALFTSGRADEAQIKQLCAKAASDAGEVGYSAGDFDITADEVDEAEFRAGCEDTALAE